MPTLGYYSVHFVDWVSPWVFHHRRWGLPAISTALLMLPEVADLEDRVDFHGRRQGQAVGHLSYFLQHFVGPNEFGLQLPRTSQLDVLG